MQQWSRITIQYLEPWECNENQKKGGFINITIQYNDAGNE